MAIHLTPEANPTVQEGTLYVDSATGEFNVAGRTTPHIIPGVLYPAISGNDINGVNVTISNGSSYTYGTPHADGRKYYYTDIKGSKPIKDPRIGGHFGSQRHKIKSIQLLEQETATHGENVYSVDGREWMRTCGTFEVDNGTYGHRIKAGSSSSFIEIVSYFNDVNYIGLTNTSNKGFTTQLNGASASAENTSFETSVTSPIAGRYVDGGSVLNLNLGLTLGINTLRINAHGASDDINLFGIELIAQDTSNRNNIQIPSQNVVSYGKKFTISAEGSSGHHYDPFNTMSYGGSGTTLSALQSLIDTNTSLGMDAWKAGTSNYHRPWNGGRVVKWVDSSGTIKTSVNMMPPNAQNIGTTASNAVSNAHVIAGTNDDTINFNTSAINNEQSELAKSFFNREFGNGSANGGTGATYRDVSMLNTGDDVAYCMDDGLTSIAAKEARYSSYDETLHRNTAATTFYLTFIGTGIARHASRSSGIRDNFAQNLPYGTHILSMKMYTNADLCRWYLDGVEILDNADSPFSSNSASYHNIGEQFHIHQPKKPPIPEDACVIADYMLMADYVAQSSGTAPFISKGVRRNNSSRDLFYETSASTLTFNLNVTHAGGFQLGVSGSQSADVFQGNLPAFATRIDSVGYGDRRQIYVDGGSAETQTVSGSAADAVAKMSNAQALGSYTFKSKNKASTDGTISAIDVVTPIHTSHHYQSFETPFLHELVGGDRNMEQNNLVCSPDGKTWDQITRDTSYIGNIRFHASEDGQNANPIILTDFRGTHQTNGNYYQKNFAIAYDRFICLKAGQYEIKFTTYNNTTNTHAIKINGTEFNSTAMGDTQNNATTADAVVSLKRGDYVQIRGKWYNQEFSHFSITEV